ncbi:tripartite tricarboxylate transporter substrate-binding protein [Donghicola tyrosinivorans]|uniref:Tripartite-type tricarboxylate transporter receptor subunit TctC n=1 Tax=Donghicola tyrosinivorans TaxID=1652492 RepID=A0A2T0WDP8_9RHOB|nr:tripartite tricarboxylate transporter substrate-binding protein [Donghicola tyrosinivorans]PRY84795.1 tripartite-type tricarboxylate transporter receptor subunit TctC [Donghicola tyrosinivorans]
MNTFLKTSVAIALTALPLAAQAEYPEKPVNFVVPFPPGDLEDVLTRMIAEDFQTKYGVAAAVINRPSDGGPFPGAAQVAGAPADGYTVGSFVVDIPVVGPQVGIPALADNPFEPLGIFLTYPFVIATSSSAPFQSLDELAAYAKDNSVVLGHFGSFLLPTQATFAAAKELGFEWGAEASSDALDCNSLASGDFDVVNTTIQLIQPCLDQITILASITESPISLAPDAPTLAAVTPDLGISLWNGLFVHKDTPDDVREKIIEVARETVTSERAQKLSAETGALVYWMDAEAAAARIASDIEITGHINQLIAE